MSATTTATTTTTSTSSSISTTTTTTTTTAIAPSLTLARSLSVSPDAVTAMTPMQLLKRQLESHSTECKVDAMKRLTTVGHAMGHQATMTELIPFLSEWLTLEPQQEHEDELLLVMSQQIQSMVGGTGIMDNYNNNYNYKNNYNTNKNTNHHTNKNTNKNQKPVSLSDSSTLLVPTQSVALALLGLLERLAGVEETVVREGAVQAMNHVIVEMKKVIQADAASTTATTAASSSTDEPPSTEDDTTSTTTTSTTLAEVSAPLVAMATRLVGAEWFTAKVSACGVLPAVYATTKRAEIRHLFRELCNDETPMVRRGAAKNLGAMIEASTEDQVLEEWVPVFHSLALQDEQDSVRLLAVANASSVARVLQQNPNASAEIVVPVIRAGCTDLSWRVRHNLAKEFGRVVATPLQLDGSTDAASSKNVVAACYAALLQDVEAEVRAAAVPHLARMLVWDGGSQLYEKHTAALLPSLADDMVMEVRSKLALALMECCDKQVPLADSIVLQTIVPLLEGFLHDEFPEVQLHVLEHLDKLSHLLGKMNGVVTILLQMVKAGNWRVRQAVAKALPHLLEARGVEFFESVLLETAWLPLLLDPVSDVRAACVSGMSMLVRVAGATWVQTEIFPHHARIYDSAASSYLTRITILQSYFETLSSSSSSSGTSGEALSSMEEPIGVGGGEQQQDGSSTTESAGAGVGLTLTAASTGLLQEVLFFLLKGLNDRVANVRMVSAKGLARICHYCEPALIESKIRPALNSRIQQVDEDEDCKHFCLVALEACG